MIDIHCHILCGVDDGAEDLEVSVEMAQIAYDDGIRHIFATPHYNGKYLVNRHIVESKTAELQKALDERNIDVTITPANEVRVLSRAFFFEHHTADGFLYLGPSNRYILLEQDWGGYCEDTPFIVDWLLARMVRPIIAHPERHPFFRDEPSLLLELLKKGAWTQITVDSLLGRNDQQAEWFACWLMKHNLVHTLATDAHNLKKKPNLSEGFRFIREQGGQKMEQEIRQRLEMILLC